MNTLHRLVGTQNGNKRTPGERCFIWRNLDLNRPSQIDATKKRRRLIARGGILLGYATAFSLLFSGCLIDLRQVPPPRYGESPVSSDARNLYLGSFDVFTSDRQYLADAWRASLLSIIKSRRVFNTVQVLPKNREDLPSEYLILDLEVRPHLDDSYNWWVTWPAVYPMVAYWPVQIRKGTYQIELKFRVLDQSGQQVLADRIKQESEQTVYFYGFFRTSPIEKMIETTNLEAMEACAKKIEQGFTSLPH